jgi:adenylyl- and sulfurtransferase ThiI
MENLLLILLLVAGTWFWWDSMNARERAVTVAAHACQQINVQLLDQTVALESIKPARNDEGRVVLRRIYGFEYSIERVERRKGRAILRGQVLEQVQLDNDEGTTIEQY